MEAKQISEKGLIFYSFCCFFSSFSIVIDGERGNRPRIYSLEQLLQEAVSSLHYCLLLEMLSLIRSSGLLNTFNSPNN